MSHNKQRFDVIQGLELFWHKLNEVCQSIALATCCLSQWDVKRRPLYRHYDDGSQERTNTCELVCTDNDRLIVNERVDCESYGLITNANFLNIIGEAISGVKGAEVYSVGSVDNRRKVFVSVRLKELEVFKAAGREHKPFLNFGNGFDLQSACWANMSIFATVCANTFAANLSVAKGSDGRKQGVGIDEKRQIVRAYVKHTKNAVARIDNMPEVIDGFLGAAAEYKAWLDVFANESMKEDNARNFFAGLLSDGAKEEEMSTRRVNQVDRLTELFVRGAGNRGENRADAFNAVTDYATHESSGRNADIMKQIVSSEFGSGLRLKERAYVALRDTSNVRTLETVGAANLATYKN